MRLSFAIFLFCSALVFLPGHAAAGSAACLLIVDHTTGNTIHEQGDCAARHAPQSTFKIPLALMGYDSGILVDEHTPLWPYKKEYGANRATDRAATDPTRWEKESVVWFSQELTRAMGMDKFKNYVDQIQYGNRDVSGDPGKDNGLTHAWLSSSLKISPAEQVAFVRGILDRTFDLTPAAYDMTIAIMPAFTAGDWTVHGKTGTGFKAGKDGLDRTRQQGWFVGWADNGDQRIAFAKFVADDKKEETYAGPRTRDAFLQELPTLMKNIGQRPQEKQ